MVLGKSTMTCVHHFSNIQNTFSALKIPCALPIHSFVLPIPKFLATEDLFMVYIFVFSRLSYTWNFVALSDWLLSLNNMVLSFLCLIMPFYHSFLFITE